MIKQTRFYLGLMLIVQAISCFFLVICYLFKDKKNTAGPFTILGVVSAIAGGVLIAEQVKEHFRKDLVLAEMEEEEEEEIRPEIPVDDTANEAEFN